ncbi:MAG: DUF4293 family protein [Bacteroidota bacterium]|nr:DUF4293 family protein [Bacteroidota bacterium]
MIQRIQTVYLAVAAIALAILLFSDAVHGSGPPARWGTLLLGIPAWGGAVAAIFMYKDRHRQRRLIVAAQVSTILAVVVLYASLFIQGALSVRTMAGVDVMRLVELMLPLAAYLCLLLARRGVTRDIRLVESMDRIR